MGVVMFIKAALPLFLFLFFTELFSDSSQSFNLSLEYPSLQNIKQITFSSMGFEKAGEGYFSLDGKTIIFQAVPKGMSNYQIYTMDLDTLIPLMVSTGKGACTCAYFHPDGQKIIFASSHEDPELDNPEFYLSAPGYKREGGTYHWDFTPYMNIYEAYVDGTNLKALTSGFFYHAECAYSSDGTKIVFASNQDGSMNIYTMDEDGGNCLQVTHTDNCYNGGPFFSPDNAQVIFRADREKPDYLQIFVCDTDGSNEKQMTNNQAVNWAPYWHPTGDYFCYTTSLHGHRHYEIYLMDMFGNDKRLTHNESFDGLGVFSNDGKRMMWTSKRGVDGTSQLFIADFQL
jgi:Tol biopolymer transport system component